MEIHLTEQESQLCTLLDECTQYMKETEGIETTCRIAGGWVRDKLLGHQCHDIDIALSEMMGVDFAQRFVKYCSEIKDVPVKGVTKIESNPEQSKHLETARTTVLGSEIDFVNLRSEEYAVDSRIPTQVTFGTPLQDALRRDITINTLFYNVHSRSVEDHTGKGLDDLRNGIIRTPLPPRETFLDDPLRVVRCVRFASRLGFDIVPELEASVRDPKIKKALVSKISRERIGEEIDKMMKGRDPFRSIKLINDLSLHSCVFYLPPSFASTLSGPPGPAHTSLIAASILDRLLGQCSPTTSSSPLSSVSLPPLHPLLLAEHTNPPQNSPFPRVWLACALTPYRGLKCTDTKKKTQTAAEVVVREGLKLGTQNRYLDGIPLLFDAWDLLRKEIDTYTPDEHGGAEDRVRIGLLLREKAVHQSQMGVQWSTSMLFSLAQDLLACWDATQDKFDEKAATSRIEQYNSFVARIDELRLPAVLDARSILDGRDTVRVLGVPPGKWTGVVLARVLEWQLQHPDGTKEQCEEWLRAEHAAGRINTSSDARAGSPPSKRAKDPSTGEGDTKRAKRSPR
ncbi:hypothetical protein IEO21_06310 [Rhodonia placenta]|uniref:Poly A polymerase head domain-containing protein n=1 Tax=Rhodonia placenta TaxID=104341 RepID=A0A8H7P0A2_9APHY|nr:hypothetical protein IEO21_06310 [Postia placenta]